MDVWAGEWAVASPLLPSLPGSHWRPAQMSPPLPARRPSCAHTCRRPCPPGRSAHISVAALARPASPRICPSLPRPSRAYIRRRPCPPGHPAHTSVATTARPATPRIYPSPPVPARPLRAYIRRRPCPPGRPAHLSFVAPAIPRIYPSPPLPARPFCAYICRRYCPPGHPAHISVAASSPSPPFPGGEWWVVGGGWMVVSGGWWVVGGVWCRGRWAVALPFSLPSPALIGGRPKCRRVSSSSPPP